ncbi:DDE domain-containing protein [Methylorubrum sp. Q1]|uniref:DDE-type integrase/transposase/recombinase n=1 Tax=Methylorubrum sp. Q1 TaxID=2562453 RepID=UPI001075EB42|nr:DDE-type integrase/transposase/recombinase [Methylorubrum sp. Q1]TFZ55380.1 DDE domain-containing protein [Methylorubrum sp. Q1]
MILSAMAAKLKRRAKGDFKGRHYEAALIVQAVSWYLRYPLSYRDIEVLFLERGVESDHFRVKKNIPRIGGFQSFHTARRTICGFEAMLWLRKGFDFAGAWTVREQNRLLGVCFGLQAVNKT